MIQVFEFPSLNQVAQYRSNKLNIPELYSKIKWILNKLANPLSSVQNEVFWSFERNSVGEAIAALYMTDDILPEAILVNDDPRKVGMATTNKSKVLACLQLKTLVEKIKNGINISSEIDIFELKNFVSSGGSYAAKSGATDDCIMALLIIVRLIKHCADFDEDAHRIMYSYSEGDFESEGGQIEPLAILF